MAWNEQRDTIDGAGTSDGTGCVGLAQVCCHFRVRLHASVWNGLQIAPDLHLKGSGAKIERQIQLRRFSGQMFV